MSKLESLGLFMQFWFSPWGAAKSEIWEAFSHDLPFTDASAEQICRWIIEGIDAHLRWQELINWRGMVEKG